MKAPSWSDLYSCLRSGVLLVLAHILSLLLWLPIISVIFHCPYNTPFLLTTAAQFSFLVIKTWTDTLSKKIWVPIMTRGGYESIKFKYNHCSQGDHNLVLETQTTKKYMLRNGMVRGQGKKSMIWSSERKLEDMALPGKIYHSYPPKQNSSLFTTTFLNLFF